MATDDNPMQQLIEFIVTLPRFDPPAKVVPDTTTLPGVILRSAPIANVDAAHAAFQACIGANSPFELDELRRLVGRVIGAVEGTAELKSAWDGVLTRVRQGKMLFGPLPQEFVRDRIDCDAAMSQMWAGWAYLISEAIDNLRAVAETIRARLSPPDGLMSVAEFAAKASVSLSTIYRACDLANSNPMPHRRIGGCIRISWDDADAWMKQQAESESRSPSSSASVPNPTRRHGPDGTVPGTGMRRPF